MLVILICPSPTVAADYDANYTTDPADAIRNATTNELRMSADVVTVRITFNITIDTIPEISEQFFLFLEGTRRVFILTPMITVCILDRPIPCEFSADYTELFLNNMNIKGAEATTQYSI